MPVCRLLAACMALLLFAPALSAADGTWLERRVRMKAVTDTRYHLLGEISAKTGYLFIYDSQVLANDELVALKKGEYTLGSLIRLVSGREDIQAELIGNHIALTLPQVAAAQRPSAAGRRQADAFITLYGRVFDRYSREPVSSATVSLVGHSTGTITNQGGAFRFTLPDSLGRSSIKISHVGYESIVLPVDSARAIPLDLYMEPKVIALQEIMIRPVDPVKEIREMLSARRANYALQPVMLTAFYREGIEHKKKNLDLTEAVLKIYKTGFANHLPDQVQLVKMRRVVDRQERDTVFTRFKSGIHSVLLLDMIKNTPDFMEVDDPQTPFVYTHTDINVIDNRLVNVISFEQRKGNKEALHKGELFIDMDNLALVEAHFELNPEYAAKATRLFVEKQSRQHRLTLRRAAYQVSYKPVDEGLYYLNHARGDLEFRVRRKGKLFSSTLKVWFEMVNCKVDTEHVQPIPRAERISPRSIFSETEHVYEPGFWEDFNVILPEDRLRELIIRNLEKP